MRHVMIVLVAAGLIAIVNSLPFVQNNNFESPTLDQLTMVDGSDETLHRTKRTIGILRQFFPEISQMIEKKVNMIVAEVIRVLGPSVIHNLLGGGRRRLNGEKTSNDDSGSTVTVAVPMDDEDDDDNNDNDDDNNNNVDVNDNKSSLNVNEEEDNGRISLPLPTVSRGNKNENNEETPTTTTSLQYSPSEGTASEESESSDISSTAGYERRSIRKQRSTSVIRGYSTSSKRSNRIGVGTVRRYRNERRGEQEQKLVAGSGSQSSDGHPASAKDGETDEAVPGPATRLLVIANRGISNLIQDLILRIAATSERFVNFKARLITSII